MKMCCDRCNKIIEKNRFFRPIGLTKIIVPNVFSEDIYYLCNECSRKFLVFYSTMITIKFYKYLY